MDTIVIKTDALRMTEEEFFLFCQQNKELRLERTANKDIVIMSPTGNKTSAINIHLNFQLELWNRKHNLGITFDSNLGVNLRNGAMRSPDVAWMPKQKWEPLSQKQKDGFLPLCPDFVIELKSPSDQLKQLQEKMKEWTGNGCRLAWLINPEDENVFIYRKDGSKDTVSGFDNELDGEDVLPGFKLQLSALKI